MPVQQLERRIAALEESVRRIETLEATIRRIEALMEKQAKELQIQFQRIAQIQAELDARRIASENVKESRPRRRPADH